MQRVTKLRVLVLGFALAAWGAATVPFSIAAPGKDARALGESGLPLPRFVSIAKPKANVRRGPGAHYPLLWQYTRAGFPLEILAEYGAWRQVRAADGTEGWMHTRLLRGERRVLVRTKKRHAVPLRSRPRGTAGTVALVQGGTVGKLKTCQTTWCAVAIGGHDGWLPRDALWGIYPFEYNE